MNQHSNLVSLVAADVRRRIALYVRRCPPPHVGGYAMRFASVLAVFTAIEISAQLQSNPPTAEGAPPVRNRVPDLRELMASSYRTNEMRAVAQRYQADRGNLTRYYNVAVSPEYFARLKWFN